MLDSEKTIDQAPVELKEVSIHGDRIENVRTQSFVHNVHAIEGTNILVHDETEEEVNARKFGDADEVTFKTWVVVTVLALSYGISFWPIPNMSYIQGQLAASLGDAGNAVWFTESITLSLAVSFLICGANSDLFGRRW